MLQLAGATYMEVHQAGGGIHFTVQRTRAASEAELLEALLPRLHRMLISGGSGGVSACQCTAGSGGWHRVMFRHTGEREGVKHLVMLGNGDSVTSGITGEQGRCNVRSYR